MFTLTAPAPSIRSLIVGALLAALCTGLVQLPATPADAARNPLRFTYIVYDPAGKDTGGNVNDERVVITNNGKRAHKIGGWKIRDIAGHRYRFPAFTLRPGAKVTVHSGNGRNTRRHLYAGWHYTWNNTGDRATLRNRAGTLIDRCRWGDGHGTTRCR